MSIDFYKILQVSQNASLSEIKLSYRRLALLLHPDRNRGGNAENFIQLTSAYKILSDPRKRIEYDNSKGYKSEIKTTKNENTKYKPHPDINISAHYNVAVWNAWHHGDNSTPSSSVKYSNSWMNMEKYNRHQEYHVKRNGNTTTNNSTNNKQNNNTTSNNGKPSVIFDTNSIDGIINEIEWKRNQRRIYEENSSKECCIS